MHCRMKEYQAEWYTRRSCTDDADSTITNPMMLSTTTTASRYRNPLDHPVATRVRCRARGPLPWALALALTGARRRGTVMLIGAPSFGVHTNECSLPRRGPNPASSLPPESRAASGGRRHCRAARSSIEHLGVHGPGEVVAPL